MTAGAGTLETDCGELWRLVWSAPTVAVLALHALEMGVGTRSRETARLAPSDGVTRQALRVSLLAVLDQGLEGVSVARELPGRVLRGMADRAELLPAVSRLVQHDRVRHAEGLFDLHAEQRVGPCASAVHPHDYTAPAVDYEGIGNG